jgi:VIT1/CCC1 family predicted Fe2+/Mn2+ transporter
MDDLAMWSLVVGFFLPLALSVVIQTGWSEAAKAAVAFLAAAAAGAGTAYFEGDLTGRSFVSAALVVLVSALATYRSFWKPTGVAPSIETATNVK